MAFGEYFGTRLPFIFDFGCAGIETSYLYTQYADGILGLSQVDNNLPFLKPIYNVLFEQGLIQQRQFTLCLGKNDGYMQIGGYTGIGVFKY